MKQLCSIPKAIAGVFSLVVAMFMSGCLISETTEYKITLNDDGKSGTIVTIMRNVQSTEAEGEKQQKDFEEAIRSWKSDEYLLQRVHDGMYVKDRSLSVEENALVWKETGIFSDIAEIFKHDLRNDTLRFTIKGDQSLVATNGTVVHNKDSTIVFWMLPTKELNVKTKENNFKPASDFAAKFKAYMKQAK